MRSGPTTGMGSLTVSGGCSRGVSRSVRNRTVAGQLFLSSYSDNPLQRNDFERDVASKKIIAACDDRSKSVSILPDAT
jgi:hypothetical protein